MRVASFVDTPGHESLMANMLSGAALMNGAILVIASNEKIPQPQTREHLLALQMLGTTNIVIAQNKIDLVSDEDAVAGYEDIKSLVSGTVAEKAPIIPLSAQHRFNIDAVTEALQENIPTPAQDSNASPVMQILRSFDINRPGTKISDLHGGAIGGTILQGIMNVGDELELRPGIPNKKTEKYEPLMTTVASLGTAVGQVDKVQPGGLVAIGTQLDPSFTKSDGLVGTVVGRPNELPPVHDAITLETQLFDMAVGAPELIKVEKIRSQENLRLNVGTAVTLGVVTSIRNEIIDVKLRRPVCASIGSRVAISRRIGERWRLIGSGIFQ